MKGCYVQKQELKLDFIREICAASTESHQKAQNCTKSHMSRTEGKIAGIPIFGYLIKIKSLTFELERIRKTPSNHFWKL